MTKIDYDAARQFIHEHASDIATLYGQSSLDNLRILQQTMWDFERFYRALSVEHAVNKEAVQTLLRLLFVLSFELKAARITEQDILTGRGMTAAMIARFDKEQPKRPIAAAGDRYPMVNIDDDVLSNELLVDYLVRGVVDAGAIGKDLKTSRFFITVADEQPWRTVWHWYERTDTEFQTALLEMERQFKQREFVVDGEILHVLGLRLFLADQGVLKLSRAEAFAGERNTSTTFMLRRPFKARRLTAFRKSGFKAGAVSVSLSTTRPVTENFIITLWQRCSG